VYFPRNDHGDG